MKTQIIKSHQNYKGGINNLFVAKVVSGSEILKSFTSTKSIGVAEKKAKSYQNKLESENTLPKEIESFLNASATFNTFGIVSMSLIQSRVSKSNLTDEELKSLINKKFASDFPNGIEFLTAKQEMILNQKIETKKDKKIANSVIKKLTKKIYQVFHSTQYGIGMQPVKSKNQKEAHKKFKKRFPKKTIISVEYSEGYKPLIPVI